MQVLPVKDKSNGYLNMPMWEIKITSPISCFATLMAWLPSHDITIKLRELISRLFPPMYKYSLITH
jgi:hypothetical protein